MKSPPAGLDANVVGTGAIWVPASTSARDILTRTAKELGVNYPIVIGKEAVGDAYGGIPFLPATFYVGRDGKVVDKIYGLKSRSDIEDDVKKSLAQGQISQAQSQKPSQN